MEINEEKSLTALIHPVSTLIISNHFTRMALLSDGKFVPVVGALLGKQSSRTVEIQNCFEIETKQEGDKWELSMKHFEDREKMYQETFPNQSFLGFYVVGDHHNVDDFDKYLYKVAVSTSDNAVVLLKMSPLVDPSNEKIPVHVFESNLDSHSGQHVLNPVPVKIISDSAEQISTDHAAKFTSSNDKNETTASKKLNEQSGALKMLWKGLLVAQDYLKAIDEGKLEPDSEVLRELNKLAIKLDFLQNRKIKSGSEDCTLNDKLIVLLTMNNKISGSIFSVIGKLNTIINEHNNPSQNPQTPMKRKENF